MWCASQWCTCLRVWAEILCSRDVCPSARAAEGAASSAAAPSPGTPPLARLLDLPTDLLERVLSRCDSPVDIARVAAVSLLFHSSLAVEVIRLWAQERGFKLPAQPEGESCAVRWLCFAALLCESNLPARAAGGARHSLFIDGEGRLSSCGKAESWTPGLLGHGEGVTRLNTPTRLPTPLGGERAVSVSAGAVHSLAITADGAVWSWGSGGSGRLGHGDEQSQPLPRKVEAFAGQRVVAVSAGGFHSLALTADGSVWSWGGAGSGKLGHSDQQTQLLPKKIEAFAGQRVVALSSGQYHSIAITADGSAWNWGWGGDGRLGHGDEQTQLLPKKVEAFAGQRVVAASAAANNNLAITADGAVWSWGWGAFGKLGHGDEQAQPAAQEGRGLCWPARRRCVGRRLPQPRHHRRRRHLYLGRRLSRRPRPRRGPVEPAAAQEGRGVGAGAVMRRAVGCRARRLP